MAAENGQKGRLSAKDRDILESIFSPTGTFGVESLVTDNQDNVTNVPDKPETENVKKARDLEILGVEKAEQGDIDGAMSLLNEAVKYNPESASLYNNRAQVYLLKGEKDAAKVDLEKSLELSNSQGKIAGQALTQLGLIHRLDGNNELALNDFQRAAELGNSFAKSQVATLNPYAALCNQMLSQAIGQLRRGESSCL